MVDLHNHLLPGVDDGAVDLDQAREALRRLSRDGVTAAVCTPHVDGSTTSDPERLERRLAELDVAWEALRRMAKDELPGFELGRGAEIMLDTPSPRLEDPRLRLAGGRYALVEFLGMMVPPNVTATLDALLGQGIIPVVAHPERYRGIGAQHAQLEAWRAAGVLLQGNCRSLAGHYGEGPRRALVAMLERGLIAYMATDYHARGPTYARRCERALAELDGGDLAALLLEENPRRVLRSQDVAPVPPVATRRAGWWRGFFRR